MIPTTPKESASYVFGAKTQNPTACKRLNGGTIHLPSRIKDRPDRDRLALRFERFKAVA